MSFLEDQTEPRPSLSSLPSTLPSTPASNQPGSSTEEEMEELSWSQEDLGQEEGLESGRQEEAGPSGSQQVPRPSGNQQVPRPRGSTRSQVPPLLIRSIRPRKASHVAAESLRLLGEARVFLRARPGPEEAYGCYLDRELQQLEEGQLLICVRLIFKIIQMALRGQLTENTHICQLAHRSPPPPATSPPPEPQPPRKRAGKLSRNAAGKRARKTK
ncbi:uncharacterized protein LOC120916777 [Rana temporaria]|uniref:uncharacterized protein LOC120916777 n=1 Tax=Rana temporaria TaxID=8407 RepID=UPI001AAE0204|nr:uncharacterized protein LOC120916777 [Rana temporaria]